MIIKIKSPKSTSRIVTLKNDSNILIGREQGDIIIDDPLISRNHVLISSKKNCFYCKDLKSTNGTYINGKPISFSQIFPDDVIIIGNTSISVENEIDDSLIYNEIFNVLNSCITTSDNKHKTECIPNFNEIKENINSGNICLALKNLEVLEKNFVDEKNVLNSLLEIGKTISSFLDPDKLITFIIELVSNIINVSEGVIHINTQVYSNEFSFGKSKNIISINDTSELSYYSDISGKENKYGYIYIKSSSPISESYLGLLNTFTNSCAISLENIVLYKEMEQMHLDTIKVLCAALESKDIYTIGHSERVMEYSVILAKELGLSRTQIENVKYSALLHDIGKIGIHENILNKPRALTKEEFEAIKNHPTIGAKIVECVDRFIEKLPAIKYHHEKWDGSGYPEGLMENKIPIEARIIAIADTFDAMTSNRAYRKALSIETAIDLIKKEKYRQFDPVIVDTFIRVYDKGIIKLA